MLDLSELNLGAAALGGFVLIWGSFSYLIKERLYMGEAPFALLVGMVLGPHCLNVLKWGGPDSIGDTDTVTLGVSRTIIGIQLVLVGVQLPPKYIRKQGFSLFMMLVPVMSMMWLMTSACIWLVIPGVPVLVALVIGSCTTATDPVLSNAVVKGAFAEKFVSMRLRNLISAESGCNDGLGYPFLFIAAHLIQKHTTGRALKAWILETCLYEVLGSAVYGAVLGWAALQLLRFTVKRNWIDKESFLIWAVGLALFTLGTAGAIGVDDLLSCFVAGNTLTWNDFYRRETEEDEVQNAVDLMMNILLFVFLGSTIPFDDFNQPELGITPGRLVLLGVMVLIFRRLPAVLAHYRFIPCIKDLGEAAFAGYYGPIGAGTIFYASLVLETFPANDSTEMGQRIRSIVKPICYFLVLTSVCGHSMTIPILKIVLDRWEVNSIRRGTAPPSVSSCDSVRSMEEDVDEIQEYGEPGRPAPFSGANIFGYTDDAADRQGAQTEPSYRDEDGQQDDGTASVSQHSQYRPSREGDGQTQLQPRRSQKTRASWRVSTGHKLRSHHHVHYHLDGQGGENGRAELGFADGGSGVHIPSAVHKLSAHHAHQQPPPGSSQQSHASQRPHRPHRSSTWDGDDAPAPALKGKAAESLGILSAVDDHIASTPSSGVASTSARPSVGKHAWSADAVALSDPEARPRSLPKVEELVDVGEEREGQGDDDRQEEDQGGRWEEPKDTDTLPGPRLKYI